jgi:hypothetical protein
MKRDTSRKLDPETMLALEKKNRQRQDRRAVGYLVAFGIVVLVLGLIYWLMRPGDPDRLNLAAYDAIGVPEESIKLYARLEGDEKHRSAKLEDRALRFQISAAQLDERVVTDAAGSAVLDWLTPKAKLAAELMVRHQDSTNPKNVVREQGHIFIWPADSKLLVVDVDQALTTGVEGLAGNTAPTVRPGAAAALQRLAAKYKIVYISPGASTPNRYKKLRSWLRQQVPLGPLLAPPSPVDSEEMETFAGGQIEQLKKRFSSSSCIVAGRALEAQTALDAGWKTVVIEDAGQAPAGATTAASWVEVAKEF